MKFSVNNKQLKKALKKIKEVVPKNSTLPVLENVRVSANGSTLTLIATDLEVTLSLDLELDVPVDKSGENLIPFAWLSSISNIHDELPLNFSFTKRSVVITGENDEYEQKELEPVANFPALPEIPKQNMVAMNNDFISWLNAAIITCDVKEELQTWKSKVNMEIMGNGIIITSTQGNMLFTHSFPAETVAETEVMVSHKIIKALDGFKETSIYWNENHIAFESENMLVIATRPEGKYVNYRAVIPKYKPNLSINRSALAMALEKASLVNDAQCEIQLSGNAGGIKINADNQDFNRKMTVELTLIKKYEGKVEKISINPQSLQKLLSQITYDQLELAIHEPTKAVLLTSETDKAYLGLLMPVATND
jgi:DNA polymerase-3 subunit beta